MAENPAFNDLPVPMAYLDGSGALLSCNQTFRHTIGLSTNTEVSASLDNLLDCMAGSQDIASAAAACLKSQQPVFVRASRRLEPEQHLLLLLTPDANGGHCVVQIVPTTEAHGLEQVSSAFGSRTASASSVSKQTVDFLSGLNHHLRTPVNGVLGIADLLAETELSKQQATYVDILSRSCNALTHLVDEIQSITYLEQGIMQLEPVPANVRDTAERALAEFADTARQKEIRANIAIDTSVPPYVLADSDKLNQILFILLDNAFRYTDQGSVTLSAGYEASASNPMLRISIKDSGIGIAMERLPSLFSAMNGDNGHKTPGATYGNTGLGLILCHKLVALMGGSIEVDSRFGHGSNFTVSFPAVATEMPAATETEGAKLNDQPATASTGRGNRQDSDHESSWNILVAEDNPVNQMLFRTVLERFGHRVTVVGNGQEAVAKVQMGTPFDIILMDISMPVMDGLNATAMIRSLVGDVGSTPILALTAHAMEGDREQFINAGMDGYQSKPVDPMTLQKAIADVIESHNAYASLDRSRNDALKEPIQSERQANELEN